MEWMTELIGLAVIVATGITLFLTGRKRANPDEPEPALTEPEESTGEKMPEVSREVTFEIPIIPLPEGVEVKTRPLPTGEKVTETLISLASEYAPNVAQDGRMKMLFHPDALRELQKSARLLPGKRGDGSIQGTFPDLSVPLHHPAMLSQFAFGLATAIVAQKHLAEINASLRQLDRTTRKLIDWELRDHLGVSRTVQAYFVDRVIPAMSNGEMPSGIEHEIENQYGQLTRSLQSLGLKLEDERKNLLRFRFAKSAYSAEKVFAEYDRETALFEQLVPVYIHHLNVLNQIVLPYYRLTATKQERQALAARSETYANTFEGIVRDVLAHLEQQAPEVWIRYRREAYLEAQRERLAAHHAGIREMPTALLPPSGDPFEETIEILVETRDGQVVSCEWIEEDFENVGSDGVNGERDGY
ncbi:hypothetical protein [Exiguobacterium flavidum]|uniref:hypothetical protein n=1 Tax=Exiguobacterium flavidum TaxID=2184695 RepID=UPI000DF79B9A|nr:hypothetical protein [Exiguobacterium flavidum]